MHILYVLVMAHTRLSKRALQDAATRVEDTNAAAHLRNHQNPARQS